MSVLHRNKLLSLMMLVGALAAMLMGCRKPLSKICANELPVLSNDMNQALMALSPVSTGRKIASEMSGAEMDRGEWQGWAEAHLKVTQEYLDVLDEDPALKKARAELSQVANLLVVFHGYAGRGSVDRMHATLEQIRGLSDSVMKQVCKR